MLPLEVALKNGEFLTSILIINPEGLDKEVLEKTGVYVFHKSKVPHINMNAVIDTGATNTIIPESVAKNLGLRKMNENICKMGNGSIVSSDQYLSIIIFQNECSTIIDVGAIAGNIDTALIGMDILKSTNFQYDCSKLIIDFKERIITN
jgi:predicted aspartyl protease